MDQTSQENQRLAQEAYQASQTPAPVSFTKIAIIVFGAIVGVALGILSSMGDPLAQALLVGLIVLVAAVLLFKKLMPDRSDPRVSSAPEAAREGLDRLVGAGLKKLHIPETINISYTTKPHVYTMNELPPELAQSPEVQKLVEEAKRAAGQSRFGSGPQMATAEGIHEIHSLSDLPPEVASDPKIIEMFEKGGAQGAYFTRNLGPEAMADPAMQKFAVRAAREAIERQFHWVYWVILIVLCGFLLFAVTALVSMFRPVQLRKRSQDESTGLRSAGASTRLASRRNFAASSGGVGLM